MARRRSSSSHTAEMLLPVAAGAAILGALYLATRTTAAKAEQDKAKQQLAFLEAHGVNFGDVAGVPPRIGMTG